MVAVQEPGIAFSKNLLELLPDFIRRERVGQDGTQGGIYLIASIDREKSDVGQFLLQEFGGDHSPVLDNSSQGIGRIDVESEDR
jgi:hypothetical protein